jgi:hypothetical protein
MDWLVENFKMVQVFGWGIFALIIWALAATFLKKKDYQKDHGELKERVKTLEQTYTEKDQHTKLASQVTRIETKLQELPDKNAMHKIEKEVGELKGSLSGINNLLKNINNQVNMLVENEIKGSK